jgi:hypothetical protein
MRRCRVRPKGMAGADVFRLWRYLIVPYRS